MKNIETAFCVILAASLCVFCSRQEPSHKGKQVTKTTTKNTTSSIEPKKRTRKVTRPDRLLASRKADDSSVSDLKIVTESIAMYDHLYEIFDIAYDNLNDCDTAAAKVKAYADKHRAEMLKAQEQMEEEYRSMSEKDQKRFNKWRQRRDMQMVNDSMKLMIELNYRCKVQVQEINSQIASLSSK